MSDVIITALISGLCVAVPSVLATVSSNKQTNKVTIYRIDELTDQVKKHNGVVERMAIAENEIKNIKHKLDM